MSDIKVSVLCLTYNQEKFIKQALDGFLTQKTNFKYEILINDDNSTDDTIKIIEEYQKKNLGIITLVKHQENLYSKGQRNFFARFLIPKARGKYLALCEGDDYWTDPNKLQKQADFLDQNTEFALCFHPVKVIYDGRQASKEVFPEMKNGFTTINLLKNNFIQTNSVMYRKQSYQTIRTDVAPGDWYLHLFHAQFGKIGFINDVMAVYRKHPGGIWWEGQKDVDKIWEKHGIMHLSLYKELLKIFAKDEKAKKVILGHIGDMINNFIRIDEEKNTKLLDEVLKKFPESVDLFLTGQYEILSKKVVEIDDMNIEKKALKDTLVHVNNKLSEAQTEIKAIKSSKIWKLSRILMSALGK